MSMIPPPSPAAAAAEPILNSETRPPTSLLTVTEFLAVIPPSPTTSSFSLCLFPALWSHRPHRVPHNKFRLACPSSGNNSDYEPIHPQTLVPLAAPHIDKFRKFIASMSPSVTFDSPHQIPFDGSGLVNEGDVTAYLTSQVIAAAWLAVQQMMAINNLMTIRQRYFENGVPDQVFGFVQANSFTPSAIIELEAPGMVGRLLSVIQNKNDGGKIDPTVDWVGITQQLRKYVINTAAPDIIIMDESTAIYFRFPVDATLELDDVLYVVATSSPSSLNPNNITLRELVAFMCYRSLVRVGQSLRDFTDTASAPVSPGCTATIGNSDAGSTPHKRPAPEEDQLMQPKRTKTEQSHQGHQEAEELVESYGWMVDQLVTLTLPNATVRTSRNPGFDESMHPSDDGPRNLRGYLPPLKATAPTATFCVTKIVTPNVAILSLVSPSPSSARFIAKIPHSSNHLDTELNAYRALSPLQGTSVPYCYGTAATTSPPGEVVLLTEFIAPGTTIADLQDQGNWARIRALKMSAEETMRGIHQHGVLHRDAHGRNFVVGGEGTEEVVVVVDFDVASVIENSETLQKGLWQDRARFAEAFTLQEGESGFEDGLNGEGELYPGILSPW